MQVNEQLTVVVMWKDADPESMPDKSVAWIAIVLQEWHALKTRGDQQALGSLLKRQAAQEFDRPLFVGTSVPEIAQQIAVLSNWLIHPICATRTIEDIVSTT
jgi:hypothetical protein